MGEKCLPGVFVFVFVYQYLYLYLCICICICICAEKRDRLKVDCLPVLLRVLAPPDNRGRASQLPLQFSICAFMYLCICVFVYLYFAFVFLCVSVCQCWRHLTIGVRGSCLQLPLQFSQSDFYPHLSNHFAKMGFVSILKNCLASAELTFCLHCLSCRSTR